MDKLRDFSLREPPSIKLKAQTSSAKSEERKESIEKIISESKKNVDKLLEGQRISLLQKLAIDAEIAIWIEDKINDGNIEPLFHSKKETLDLLNSLTKLDKQEKDKLLSNSELLFNCMRTTASTIDKLERYYVGNVKVHNELIKLKNEIAYLMDENKNMQQNIQNQLKRIDLRGQLVIKAITKSELVAEKFKRRAKQLEKQLKNTIENKPLINQNEIKLLLEYKTKYLDTIDVLRKQIKNIEESLLNLSSGSIDCVMRGYAKFLDEEKNIVEEMLKKSSFAKCEWVKQFAQEIDSGIVSLNKEKCKLYENDNISKIMKENKELQEKLSKLVNEQIRHMKRITPARNKTIETRNCETQTEE